MASAPRRRRAPTAVELERDAAIEEAALAVFALRQVQSELQELRCRCAMNEEATRDCINRQRRLVDKQSAAAAMDTSTSSNHGLNVAEIKQIQTRNGNLTEKMWSWCVDATANNEPSRLKCIQTLYEVKCAALEEFQSLIPSEDTYVYDEMHRLYKRIARYEKLQASMEQEVQRHKLENEELRVQLQELSDRLASAEQEIASAAMDAAQQCTLEQGLNEPAVRNAAQTYELQRQLDEKARYIDQLLITIKDQAAEIDSLAMLNSAIVFPSPAAYDLNDANGSRVPSGGPAHIEKIDDEFEAPKDAQTAAATMLGRIQPREATDLTSGTKSAKDEPCTSSADSESILILQAQLEMYARYFQRKKGKSAR